MKPAARPPRLILAARTAEELMTPNPISINETATVKEAVAFLVDRGLSAAPVIDFAGKPVGVLSQTDIVIHDRNRIDHARPVPEYYRRTDLETSEGEQLGEGFQVEKVDATQVRDLMTPVVIGVGPRESVIRVVGEMVALRVHRLFVVDDQGALIGVISAFDILRKLQAQE